MSLFSKISQYITKYVKEHSIKIDKKKVLVVFLSGPSGVGKTTIENKLLSINDVAWSSLRSTTTRLKRSNNFDDSYNFISVSKFNKMIANNEFFFHMKSNYSNDILYGFSKKDLVNAIKKNNVVIINAYSSTVKTMKNDLNKMGFSSISIFILPPSFNELKKRIQNRNTENKHDLISRLNNAKKEIFFAKYYDYQVINDKLQKTVKKINNIIHSHLAK